MDVQFGRRQWEAVAGPGPWGHWDWAAPAPLQVFPGAAGAGAALPHLQRLLWSQARFQSPSRQVACLSVISFCSPVFLKRWECKINVASGDNCSSLACPQSTQGLKIAAEYGKTSKRKHISASSLAILTCLNMTIERILAIVKNSLILGKLWLQLLTPKCSLSFERDVCIIIHNSKGLEQNHGKFWVLGLFLHLIPTYVDEDALKYFCQRSRIEKWTLGHILLDIFSLCLSLLRHSVTFKIQSFAVGFSQSLLHTSEVLQSICSWVLADGTNKSGYRTQICSVNFDLSW